LNLSQKKFLPACRLVLAVIWHGLIESALTTLGVWHDNSVATGLCAPRHLLAYVTNIAASQPDRIIEKRGPRVDAPAAAIAGFLKSAWGQPRRACGRRYAKRPVLICTKRNHLAVIQPRCWRRSLLIF
jgi:glycyl-tRNA synthetase beta subunit